jgi:hypothetical protein
MKNLSQDSEYPDQDSHWVPLDFKPTALLLDQSAVFFSDYVLTQFVQSLYANFMPLFTKKK